MPLPEPPRAANVSITKRKATFGGNIGVQGSLTLINAEARFAPGRMQMAHSLIGADRITHLKILGVALVAGVVFVAVGVAAHMSDFETAGAMTQAQPVLKAGKSTIFTTNYDVTIR
jgi:hypothetical protein